MSVMFDLTIAGAELFDSVIFMDNSPAYEAFKEEIEKILADFNKTGRFKIDGGFDPEALAEDSVATLVQMHRAYLIWSFNEDYGKLKSEESRYTHYVKLFIKAQTDNLVALNGGSKLIGAENVVGLKQRFLDKISSDNELFDSIKSFFSGYVYGYFFNYLTEQTIMKDYAEFLFCLGLISGKITASESQKQKIFPKMAILLNNDRFKYISGEIPIEIILNIICDRFSFDGASDGEIGIIRGALRDYMVANYEFIEADNLISSTVVTDIMTKLNPAYTNSENFSDELHISSFAGTRTFLDCDNSDMGEFMLSRVIRIVADKCAINHEGYYSSGRDGVIEVALGAGIKGYRYPLVYKDGATYWFADIYKELLFPAIDSAAYISVTHDELPIKEYPFADIAFKSNIIRYLGGLQTAGYTIRADKLDLLSEIKAINSDNSINEEAKHMKCLEKTLYLISGNMDASSYQRLVDECIFGTQLYERYIRYRMDCLFADGMKSGANKKKLLDELNAIN